MLQQMREAQGWLIKGMLWAVVFAFIVTSLYFGMSGSSPTSSEVATVLGHRVGVAEFQRVQNNLYQNYRNIFGNRADFDLRERFNFREMALEQIVRQALLKRMAKREQLDVTDVELYESIATIPAFQEEGKFNPELYLAVLRQQVPPIVPQVFEEQQREALLAQKVYDLVTAGVNVTEAEVVDAYQREHEQAAARYVTLIPNLFDDEVTLTDEELQAHYEAEQGRYQNPEQRQIKYVTIAPARFPYKGEIAPDLIEDYYDGNEDEFTQPERVQARHILLKVPSNVSDEREAEIRQQAEELLQQLRDGADFAELAMEHSEDEASAEKGGDLGTFPQGQMVAPFDEAVFALEVGALSEPVRTTFGFHIIRLDDKLEAGIKSLEDVKEEIENKLRQEREQEAALAFVDDIMVFLEEDPQQFEALAKQHDLEITTAPFVPSTGRLPDLAQAPQIVPRAFALNQGAIDTQSTSDGTHYIFQVAEIQEASTIPFDEAKERVTSDLKQQKSRDLANQTADDWAAKLQSGTSLEELAKTRDVQVAETGLFKRNDSIPQYGRSAAFSRMAFDVQPGESAAVHDGNRHAVIQVTERKPADMADFEAQKQATQEQLLRQKQQQARAAFDSALRDEFQQLRESGKIVVNPQYVF
ncbi:peptidylprolyl isomerase [Candidatus Entotheonella palauensis]|uniref:peptidylprolyl isomerase n=1 Tax=Candidatus Entotheonella palauensis TaxID=93172 RepID=UPI000B8015A8|nr:peptidylprolyl isomerase [Candidatus Entotheonella palauensis]